MKPKKEIERHEFTPDELQRMEEYLELQTARLEVIGLLDNNSGSFADWSMLISEAVHESIARKQKSGIDCEKEQKMLDNLSYLFTKLAYYSGMLSDWHKQMAFRVENTEKMIE